MTIVNLETDIHNVCIFKDGAERKSACDFIQGAVYAWIAVNSDKSFGVRDLFGGNNTWAWAETPLEPLWDNYRKQGKTPDEAFELAAKAAGKLLKRVLQDDKRKFQIHSGYNNSYTWILEE